MAKLVRFVEKLDNGQTESQANRLKTIKRRLYGRAGFELLRVLVVPLAP